MPKEEGSLVSTSKDYVKIGIQLGELLAKKNAAYGNSFHKCQEFLQILYPNGVPVHSYQDMLTIARVFDKLMRIATAKDAFGEDPWKDIAGYALLMVKKNNDSKNPGAK